MVMCYNILCDKYCTRQLYGYCPPWALNWQYRRKIILEEVQQYNADIVSLQVAHELFYFAAIYRVFQKKLHKVYAPQFCNRTSQGHAVFSKMFRKKLFT